MSKFKNIKDRLTPNKPVPSTRPGKKRMVLASDGKKEKLIHYGADGYKSNYSKEARDNFRARHNCDTAKDKLTARYWACEDLWQPSSTVYSKEDNKKKKG